MSRRLRRRPAQIRFTESARKQVDALTDAEEVRRLDRALNELAIDPEMGVPTRFPLIRDYRNDAEGVRVIYSVSVLRSAILVAYVEA
ncbi:hypothetical protein [Streptacidiphilus jiangxiensis]|uniref:Type II toxin-antitoxin system RelE/ParE family toxin n=1 Tax=Streptacidiphilus jiangxiensis TaxID=235985 RepID=A0A1H7UD51_STRJI|nr:hypothetical protein [Streptacidiphilus jiangxiensis]SEL94694.1 hypothetical protein SAMN05414137_115213 [Streptacidiphilus jiangxiensis]